MVEHSYSGKCRVTAGPAAAVAMGIALLIVPFQLSANGYDESSPWQFATPAERQTNAQIADMIARRNGGYYDGFQTNVSNVTNIGTQVNCNNVADATANRATNGQEANSPNVQLASGIDSNATGNDNSTTPLNGDGTATSDQSNTGTIDSSISNSDGSVSSGAIETGNSAQDIENHQENSGNQSAQINDSTACALNGGEVSGEAFSTGNSVESSGAPLN